MAHSVVRDASWGAVVTRLAFFQLLAVAAAMLLACGGSSSSGPTAPGSLDVAGVEEQSFKLINDARAEQSRGALSFDSELSRVAREHSRAMRDRGFFGHTDPDGNGLRSRLTSQGVVFSAAGENLAQVDGTADPAGLAHQQLLASAEHRAVMLDGRFVSAGVGVAGSGDTFWITQVYLRP